MNRFERHLRSLDPDQLLILWCALIVMQSDEGASSAGRTIELAVQAIETRLQGEGE